MNHLIVDQITAYDFIKATISMEVPTLWRDLAGKPLKDIRFTKCPAASGHNHNPHHTGEGGLLIHTAQVLQIALGMGRACGVGCFKVPETVIAAVWHDYGKVQDYISVDDPEDDPYFSRDSDGKYTKTRHYSLCRHLVRSVIAINAEERSSLTGIDWLLVEHIMLSHHGRHEWGSPVEPQTPEAWAVHAADMMSAQFLGMQ